jgi:hypothetical protein
MTSSQGWHTCTWYTNGPFNLTCVWVDVLIIILENSANISSMFHLWGFTCGLHIVRIGGVFWWLAEPKTISHLPSIYIYTPQQSPHCITSLQTNLMPIKGLYTKYSANCAPLSVEINGGVRSHTLQLARAVWAPCNQVRTLGTISSYLNTLSCTATYNN